MAVHHEGNARREGAARDINATLEMTSDVGGGTRPPLTPPSQGGEPPLGRARSVAIGDRAVADVGATFRTATLHGAAFRRAAFGCIACCCAFLLWTLFAARASAAAPVVPGAAGPGEVAVTLVQLNDVYEIESLDQPVCGGLARVATLVKEYRSRNPHTYVIMAGDFLSPSALGSAKVNGKLVAGQQMVETLQTLPLKFATFGNHEFDLDEEHFLARTKELQGELISCNVFDKVGKPYFDIPGHRMLEVPSASKDTPIRIALVGVTLPSPSRGNYATFGDPVEAMAREVGRLGPTDAIVAITHLALATDTQLVDAVRAVDITLGGHEHANNNSRLAPAGAGPAPGKAPASIFKADANALTIYVHELIFDAASRKLLRIDSQLHPISTAIPEDQVTATVVKRWVDAAWAGFKAEGFDPGLPVTTINAPLEGRDEIIRHRPSDLTRLVCESMLRAVTTDGQPADFAVFNSGSIRVDDVIPAGPLRVYDILRILPFGGDVWLAKFKGTAVQKMVDEAVKPRHIGAGSFLQFCGLDITKTPQGATCRIDGQPLDPEKTYLVAIDDYLLDGREDGFPFLKENLPGAVKRTSMWQALIDELKRIHGKVSDFAE